MTLTPQFSALLDRLASESRAGLVARKDALAAAASPVAQRIIDANPLTRFHYGMTGSREVFASLFQPTASDLKRQAAEAIIAHRRMRAAGGNGMAWLDRAARYRRQAAILARFEKRRDA